MLESSNTQAKRGAKDLTSAIFPPHMTCMPRPNRTSSPILKRELTPLFHRARKAAALALIFFDYIT